jgi:two-component system, NarL family, nitrate/nitrite response regulator NarL
VTRVVVADDHPPTRELVARALSEDGFDVVASVHDAASAVAAVIEHGADLAVLDIRMPGSGIKATRELTRRRPETAVVMLTVSTDDEDLFAAIGAGAVGYIVKGAPTGELAELLRRVLEGESALPPNMVRRLVEEFGRRDRDAELLARRPKLAVLSDREREVLDLLAQGLTTRAIATRMYVAPVTVRSHVAAILRKLEVPDRRSAVDLLHDGD